MNRRTFFGVIGAAAVAPSLPALPASIGARPRDIVHWTFPIATAEEIDAIIAKLIEMGGDPQLIASTRRTVGDGMFYAMFRDELAFMSAHQEGAPA